MSKRDLHVGKTSEYRRRYLQDIGTLDYEPTVDERLNFKKTSQTGEELTPISSQQKRPISLSERIKEHLSNNWLAWVLVLIGIGVTYLVYDSKVEYIKISSKLESQTSQIQDIKSSTGENNKQNQQQDVKIAETAAQVSQIQKTVDETRKDVKDLRNELQSVTKTK